MLTKAGRLVQAISDRLLKQFEAPEMRDHISYLNPSRKGGIDDGDYGDPFRDDDRPAFVKRDDSFWTAQGDNDGDR